MNLLLKLLNSKEDFHVSAIGLDLLIKLELLVLIVCMDVQDTGQTQGGWKQCTSNSTNPRKRSVRYLPRYASAMKPPSNGVRQVVPAQVVTVFAAVGTPKCISSTKYVTKLMTTPKNAKLSRELDTAHGYVENSCNKKSYITY